MRVGTSDWNGCVRTSKFKAGLLFSVDAASEVLLDELEVQTSWARVGTEGAEAELTNSRFLVAKNGTGMPKFLEVSAGAGSTRDVTDTLAVNMTVTIDCDTVIGR